MINVTERPQIITSMTEAEADELSRLADGKIVLEIGSWLGFSTVTMAWVAKTVFAVDWHRGDMMAGQGETLNAFLENLAKHDVRHKVVPMVGRCEAVLPVLRSGSFDLVFVDGLHTKEAVMRDANQALALVAPGGVVAFHDYGVWEVKDALDAMNIKPDRLVDTLAIVEQEA